MFLNILNSKLTKKDYKDVENLINHIVTLNNGLFDIK